MLIPYHFSRDCVFDEAVEVVLCRKDTPENVNNMVFVLETNKMPRHYGLNETNVIYRHHNDAKIMELMNVWWDFIEKYSKRDQLSLSYVRFRIACRERGRDFIPRPMASVTGNVVRIKDF